MDIDTTTETPENGGVPQSSTLSSSDESLKDNQDTVETSNAEENTSDLSNEENKNSNNGNDTNALSSDEDRDLRRQIGEKNSLLIESLKEKDPTRLQELLKNDASLRKTAEKQNITIESLESSTVSSSSKPLETPSTPNITDELINSSVRSSLGADDRAKIQKRAEKLSSVIDDKSIAIETAQRELGFLSSKGETLGAGVLKGGSNIANGEGNEKVSQKDFLKMTATEQYEYQAKNGRSFT